MFTSVRARLKQVQGIYKGMERVQSPTKGFADTPNIQSTCKRHFSFNDSEGSQSTKRRALTGSEFTQSFGAKFPHLTTTGTRRFSKDMFVYNTLNIEQIIEWTEANHDKHGTIVPQFQTILKSLKDIVSYYNLEKSVILNNDDVTASDDQIKSKAIKAESIDDTFSTPLKRSTTNAPILLQSTSPITQKREMSTLPLNSSPPKIQQSHVKDSISTKNAQFESATQVSGVKQVIQLSQEQQEVANLVLRGHNIFYTGSAGTGKSFLLKHIVKILNQKFGTGVAVTASTGLAAYNIGGMTINSYLGIGIGMGKPDGILRRIKNNKKIKERWLSLNVLIIDEVSMINGLLLDKLDWIARKLLDNNKPFGGIQIVLCGDFYQLPPVDSKKDKFHKEEVIYAFESKFWQKHIKLQIILEKVFRQQSDKVFLEMLQEVRDGEVSESTIKKFQSLSRPLSIVDGVLPTRLFPTRRETDAVNKQMLQNLPGESFKFSSVDSGSMIHSDQGRKMLENFLAPAEVELKVGAQVMLIKNMDDKLVNGTLGIVVGFMDNQTFSQVKGLNSDYFNGSGEESMTYYDYDSETEEPPNKQFGDANRLWRKVASPLNSSIFDCLSKVKQGILNDMDLTNMPGSQTVVPLEATSDAPYIPSDNSINTKSTTVELRELRADQRSEILKDIERKEELIRALNENSGSIKYPLVAFKIGDKERRMVLVHSEEFVIEDEKRVPVISRKQVPIMLSWALSIHKSQGQTLQKVTVDLKKVFETGQAYVALSRAVHRRGLQVVNFQKDKIRTNPKVKDFYQKLFTATEAISMIDNGQLNPDTSDYLKPAGQMTQLENLAENTASPERFIKYQSRKKPNTNANADADPDKNSISSLLARRTPSQTNNFLEVSDSEM